MEIDLSQLDPATRKRVDEIFRNDFDLKVAQAVQRQTKIAARNHRDRPRARTGFGARTMEIDAVVDSLWRQFYGHNYSEDKDLLRFLQRRNPEIQVRPRGEKITSGYAPGDRSSFRKKYNL